MFATLDGISILAIFVQVSNAELPILVTLEGIFMLVRL